MLLSQIAGHLFVYWFAFLIIFEIESTIKLFLCCDLSSQQLALDTLKATGISSRELQLFVCQANTGWSLLKMKANLFSSATFVFDEPIACSFRHVESYRYLLLQLFVSLSS